MVMIELTAQDGERLAVNPALIWHVRRATGDQTAVYAVGGAALFVQGSYAKVVAAIERHIAGKADHE